VRRWINKVLLRRAGYEISRLSRDSFTVAGIRYEVDPCSVGMTPEGEIVANGAIRMIRQRALRSLRVLDLGCGVGIIGLTMLSRLGDDRIIDRMGFADINIFNLQSLRRTVEVNGLKQSLDGRMNVYLSDSLAQIPAEDRFDLIVCNPPHYRGVDLTRGSHATLPRGIGTYDAEWRFHASIYAQAREHLTDTGELWMFENSAASTSQDFLPFVEGSGLRLVEQISEPLDSRFYWMITRRV
jgi:methylase of polypeptide subunit release factors